MAKQSREIYLTKDIALNSILSKIASRLDLLEGLRPDLPEGILYLSTGNKVTTMTGPLPVKAGGTGTGSFTDHGILIGSGTDAIQTLSEASDGQIPIGSTGTNPVLATLKGTATQVGVVNLPGSIIININDHISAVDPHTQYQKESEKDSASGYAGLNASTRTTKGIDTTDDVIIDLATKGLVLKDTQATPHYWRVTVSILGVLTTTDLGTVKP